MNQSCCIETQVPQGNSRESCCQCETSVPSSWIAKFEAVNPDFSEPICYKCASILLVPKLKRDNLKKLSGPFLKEVIECYSSQAQSKVLFSNHPPGASELAYDFILNSCHTIPEFRMKLYKENWSTVLDAELYLDSVKALISIYASEGNTNVPRFNLTTDGLRTASLTPVRPPPTLFIPPPPSSPPPKSFQSRLYKLYSPSLNNLNLNAKEPVLENKHHSQYFCDDTKVGKQFSLSGYRTFKAISESLGNSRLNFFRRSSPAN